jgi:WD40 repeat protein
MSSKMNAKGKIMRKLLGQPATTTHESIDTRDIESQLRPSASQNTIYSAGAPITCLDRSADGQRAVIAGPKVFKILRIDGSTITQELDLRAIIMSFATTHDPSAATSDQLNIRAVIWSYGTLENIIVTASGNGRITVYDLNRIGDGLEIGRIQEHARQVHRLAISPFKNNWLLSASQDGTVKRFDIKAPIPGRNGPTFRVLQSFKCNADAVRDVKWSPTDGMEFACCTDAGMVQKWDISKSSAPVLKISAHQSACFTISWHPDGDHLVSGGLDQLCHVWDMSKKADRNQKPRYTFATPAPISRVSWRPACWSATAHGKRAAQIAVAYDDANAAKNQTSNVHIWDLARPAMPFKEIEQWNSAPSSLIWNTRDLLWSADKEGHFIQTDVAFVTKLIDRRSLSSFSIAPTGHSLLLLEERQSPRRPRPSITPPEVSPKFEHNGSGPLMSVSRSESEEDVVGSFLGPRLRKGHRRRNSGRSGQSLSTTPPSSTGMTENRIMSLNEAVEVTGIYKPQQVSALGHAPSTAKRVTYKYFTNRYLFPLAKKFDGQLLNVRTTAMTESYAKAAEDIGHFRLAQTWRLLGYIVGLLLIRRAEHHREARLTVQKPESKKERQKQPSYEATPSQTPRGGETPRKLPRAQTPVDSPAHRNAKSIIAEEMESTSNVATPLVRPRDSIAHETREAMHTPMIDEEDELQLPDAVHPSTPSPIPVPGARNPHESSTSSMEGYDFYDIDSFAPLEIGAPPRKPPLRLDYPTPSQPPRIQPQRHDSGESFQMFSTSGDSQHGQWMSSSGSDGHSVTKERGQSLRDRVANWESNLTAGSKHRLSIDSPAPLGSESSEGHFTPHSNESGYDFLSGRRHGSLSPPVLRLHEASARPTQDRTPSKIPTRETTHSPSISEMASENPNLIKSDFLPWPNDPAFLIISMDPTLLIQRTLNFESSTSALNAAIMILLFRPLLPASAIDEFQAGAIIRQYHQRLTNLKLFTEAALLRNLSVPSYPTVFATAQEDVKIGFFCTGCNKPLENDPLTPGSEWKCLRCKKELAPCAICLNRELEPDLEFEQGDVKLKAGMWWLCPGCGHGGHSSCMQAWHAGPEFGEGDKYSGGCCPLEGCLHPCLPGKWREKRVDEKKAARAKELDLLVKENSRQGSGRGPVVGGRGQGLVRRDNREVNQSKAVEGVRVALSTGTLSGGSPGASLERKKSVKLVAPGEEGLGGHGL